MTIIELSTLTSAIIAMSVEAAREKTKRREIVLKLLKRFKLDSDKPSTDFDHIYIYTLIEYGVFKPEPILNFFQNKFVIEAFRLSFYKDDLSILDKEAEDTIQWNEEMGKLGKIEYDPRYEFATFSAIFTEIVNHTSKTSDGRHILKLNAHDDDLQYKMEAFLEHLDKLNLLDEIRAELTQLIQSHKSRQSDTVFPSSKLKVFISSTMMELRDVREFVSKSLADRGIDAWVYETQAGARPDGIVETSLHEVEVADVYIGLFWKKYGEVTAQEYLHARVLGRPCFVYIRDKDIQREIKLEDFLRTQVYDLRHGVTCNYFDSAVKLGEQVADDIMIWLVRRHREMTAEIQENRVSENEITHLQAEVNRLQKISREHLPTGTALDYLAQQLKVWFETLNYRFERYEVRDRNYFDWIINVPTRRGYDRILIHAINGEAQISDVVALRQAVNAQRTDEGWIVAIRRISQAARDTVASNKNHDLFCYTFDDLLDEHADFSGYLNWLEAEIKRREIDKMYIMLACTKEEFDPITKQKIGESHYNERNGWIDGYIDRWLGDPSKEHISILGEFGSGKTWFALHYAWIALQRYRDAKNRGIERPRLPLYIPLRDYAKAVNVESLFSEFFFRKHEIPLPGYSVFEQLNRMGKLLLIFDGFDEMAARVDRQKMINNFWELTRVVLLGAKVVLTCRTEHFPDAREGRALLNAELRASISNLTGEPPQFEVLELEEFSETQIYQVLSLKATASAIKQVMKTPSLMELAGRPVMTDIILEALPEIEAGKPVDLSRVYLYAVKRKMERDIKADRTFTSLADKLYFLCELSWKMLITDQMSLNYRLFPDELRQLFGPAVQAQKDLDHWHYDMMSQTMLIRNSDGDYTPAHRSLLEFFVAYKFAAELGMLAPDFAELAQNQSNFEAYATAEDYTWSSYFHRDFDERGIPSSISPLHEFVAEDPNTLVQTIGIQPITKAIADLLSNMLNSKPTNASSKFLGDITQQEYENLWNLLLSLKNRSFDETKYLAGNIATILKLLGISFAGRDLSHLCLAGASFADADLTETNFSDSLLLGCNFSNCNLTRSIFTNAEFKDTSWGESGSVYSLDCSPDSHNLVAGVQGEGLKLWNLESGELISALSISDTIYATRFSHQGNYLAFVTRSGEIRVYDKNLQTIVFRSLTKHYRIENVCFGFDENTLICGVGSFLHIINILSGARKLLQVDTITEIRCLASHYQNNLLAVSSSNGFVSVLSGSSYKSIFTKHHHQGSIRALDINATGETVASGGKDARVVLTEIPTGVVKSEIQVPGSVFSTSFNPQCDHLAVSTHGKQVVILNVPGLQILHILKAHKENVRELRYSQDGTKLMTASYDGSIKIWSVPSYQIFRTIEAENGDKRRMSCYDMYLDGAKGLTDEYIAFFRERGANVF